MSSERVRSPRRSGGSIDRIAVIKVGWSEDYQGGPVEAAHKHVKQHKDGHEKYNFLPGPDGRFYAYAPPVSGYEVAPRPERLDGWLVFSVAKHPRRSGLYLTGWYEAASFAGEYLPRPEYDTSAATLPLDDAGEWFSYTVSADKAVQIYPDETPFVFRGDHMKRSPVYYLRGNGAKAEWCKKLINQLLTIRRSLGDNAGSRGWPRPAGGAGVCADPKLRKEVEVAAVKAVRAHFPDRKFEIDDRQNEKCGFDLLVRSRINARHELHVEVKGTQNTAPHFLMSRSEYAYMLANPQKWRLAMVTQALSKKPLVEIMDVKQAKARFFWNEFSWHATARMGP